MHWLASCCGRAIARVGWMSFIFACRPPHIEMNLNILSSFKAAVSNLVISPALFLRNSACPCGAGICHPSASSQGSNALSTVAAAPLIRIANRSERCGRFEPACRLVFPWRTLPRTACATRVRIDLITFVFYRSFQLMSRPWLIS